MNWNSLLAPDAQAAGVPVGLAQAVMNAESSGNPNAVSPAGAMGLMQLMPATAKSLGVTNPMDPAQNIRGGTAYLGQMLKQFKDPATALAAYNWGPGNVQKYGAAAAPASTKSYVSKIMAQLNPVGTAQAAELPSNLSWLNQPLDSKSATQTAPALPENLQWLNAPIKEQASVPAQTAPTASTPQNEPGILASIGAGLGHGVGTTVLGVQQLLGNGLDALGATTPGNWLVKDANSGIQRLDSQYAPYSGAHPIVAGAGNLGGQIAAMAPTMMVGPEYAALSLPGKIAMGAAQGAAGSAMLPVSPGSNEFWRDKALQTVVGGAFGGAIPGAIGAGKAVGHGIYDTLAPVIAPTKYVGKGVAEAMSPQEAAQAAVGIRSAAKFVPGSVPTTAQAAATPTLVQTEKAASNIPEFKTAIMDRSIANNQARWNALMSVARSPDELAQAMNAREAATGPLYDLAADQAANAGKGLIRLAQRPAVRDAMQRANQLAANRGETLKWPEQGGDMSISGRALDYTKQSLADMASAAKAQGNKSLAAGIGDALDRWNGWTQTYIPAQREAAQQFAKLSVPVNTMEAGQQIANAIGTRPMNAGGVPEIQLMPYRSALQSAIKGQKYGIDPSAHQLLQGIGQDLQRATVSNSVRTPGSDTAYNIAARGWLARNLYGPTFAGATGAGKTVGALGAALTGHPMIGLGILGGGQGLGKIVGGKLNSALTEHLMSPTSLLPYLDRRIATAPKPVQKALMRGLLQYGRPSAVNAVTGGLLQEAN